MAMEPPPRLIGKFEQIWRDWLYFFWDFVFKHTGGSTPTLPATGSSWNAHGNTATGAAASPLKVEEATFWVDGIVGDSPASFSGASNGFAYIPSKFALRGGATTGTQWGTIGDYSLAYGFNAIASASGSIAIGSTSSASNTASIALGASTISSGANSVAIGSTARATGITSLAVGSGCRATNINSVSVGISNIVVGVNSIAVGRNIVILGEESICLGDNLSTLLLSLIHI